MMLQIDGSPEPGGTSYWKRVLRWVAPFGKLIQRVESFFAFTYNVMAVSVAAGVYTFSYSSVPFWYGEYLLSLVNK
jgi:hypothetical protein